jgi:hypothetical protein
MAAICGACPIAAVPRPIRPALQKRAKTADELRPMSHGSRTMCGMRGLWRKHSDHRYRSWPVILRLWLQVQLRESEITFGAAERLDRAWPHEWNGEKQNRCSRKSSLWYWNRFALEPVGKTVALPKALLPRRPKAIATQEGASSVVLPVCPGASFEPLPLGLNHPSEKKRLKIKDLEHVLIGKAAPSRLAIPVRPRV